MVSGRRLDATTTRGPIQSQAFTGWFQRRGTAARPRGTRVGAAQWDCTIGGL